MLTAVWTLGLDIKIAYAGFEGSVATIADETPKHPRSIGHWRFDIKTALLCSKD